MSRRGKKRICVSTNVLTQKPLASVSSTLARPSGGVQQASCRRISSCRTLSQVTRVTASPARPMLVSPLCMIHGSLKKPIYVDGSIKNPRRSL
jgi:hypothetical protein